MRMIKMYSQDFNLKEFKKLLCASDYSLLKKHDKDIDTVLTIIEKQRKPLNQKFLFLSSITNNNKKIYLFSKVRSDNIIDVLAEDLYLRKANQNIKKSFGVKPSDRLTIIKNVIGILKEASLKKSDIYLLRTDIKSFFESLNRKKLEKQLYNSALISYETKKVISNLFLSDCFNCNVIGIPRGLNISSTLSEIAMKQFDKSVISNPDVFYYARFVDDIIIFSTKEITTKDLISTNNYSLPKELIFNELKTNYINFQKLSKEESFQFLGYKFSFYKQEQKNKDNLGNCRENNSKQKESLKLVISISPKKINKIKSRIIKSFLDFNKNKDYILLKKRIKFLASSYSLASKRKKIQTEDSKSVLKSGLVYNYQFIDDYTVLKNLDSFLVQVIYSKGKFLRFNSGLNKSQCRNLANISFFKNFISCHFEYFSSEDLSMIKRCWG